MANEEIVLRINPIMETGDVKKAVDQIEGFFNKMNLSGSMKSDVAKIFKDMRGEAETFERASKEAFKTPGEVKSFEKSGQRLSNHFEKLVSVVNKLGSEDLSKLFTIDDSKIAGMTQEVTKLQQKINNLTAAEFDKINNSIKQMHSVSKSGNIDAFLNSLKSGNFSGAENALKGLIQNLQAFKGSSDETRAGIELMLQSLESGKIDDLKGSFEMLQSSLEGSEGSIKTYAASLGQFINLFSVLSSNGDIQKTVTEVQQLESGIGQLRTERIQQLGQEMTQLPPKIQKCNTEFDQMSQELTSAARHSQELNREISEVGQRATYFLSLENSIDLFRQGVQQAIDTVKELDKAMAETAVVTDFSIGDMWDKLPEYTQMANELGVATQGVYEASTLYYQQGLQTEQVMALTAETLKMARIAGLECADATNLMTAALRGFNMEINETSAQRVNDVYSELAAITAADTNEIATAMTKTASIAASANMELETTAALLAQMIETTREPAETAGTAMKTIVARFTEMKKAASDVVSVDGEEVSVNKVDAALASVGVSLKNAKGEFRDLDDVLLELASKWNSLDIMSQRYIATTAAGSRQQSRFIAMMQDYERTMELVDAAYNSAGSSSKQFEKTQESLESKMSRMENAWNTFLMGIADDKIIKTLVDALTGLLNAYNKLTEGIGGVAGSALRLTTVFAGLRLAKLGVDKLVFHFANLKLQAEGAVAAVSKLSIIDKFRLRLDNFKNTGKFSLKGTAVDPEAKTSITASQQLTTGASKSAQIQVQGATEAAKLLIDGAAAAAKIGQEGAVVENTTKIEGEQAANTLELTTASTESGIETTAATAKAGIEVAGEEAGAAVEVAGEVAGAGISAGKGQKPDVSKMLKGGGSLKGGFTKAFSSMKAGVTSLISTLAPLAPLIGVLVAEVGLLAAAWYFSPEQTLKREIEDATNAAKSAQEVFNNVNSTLNEMTSSRETFAQMREEFKGMTKGTSEWRSQLAEINAEVLKLIRIYPELAQYKTYGENGELQLTEEGWDTVIQKQTQYAATASTSNTVAATRVEQLQSELDMYQALEDKQDELAVGDSVVGTTVGIGSGVALGTVGAVTGAGMALGGGFVTGVAGMAYGAVAGSVVPVIGTAIGALVGIIAGAAIGYATNKAIENATENSEEYQDYKRELEQQQEAERQARLQQYSSALYNEFSTDEEMSKDENLGTATELMAESFEKNMEDASKDMWLGDWASDGATIAEIEEWAKNLGYVYKDGKIKNQAGEVIYEIEVSGNEHEGEEGWITNEQIAQQLAVQRATNTTEKQTKELLGIMKIAENKLNLGEGGFTDLFYGDDLSGKQIRQLMETNVTVIKSELEQMSAMTGQNMSKLMQDKIEEAEKYYHQMNEKMVAYSNIFSSENQQNTLEDFEAWTQQLTDEQYGTMLDTYQEIESTMGSIAGGFYVNALQENAKDFNKIQGTFDNIDFSNPISAFADLKRVSEEAKGSVKETADTLLEMGTFSKTLGKSEQWKYFFNSTEFEEVRKSLDEIKAKGQQITSENIYEMAESSELLRDMLNSGAAGAQSLLVAIEGLGNGLISTTDLTENFVEALGGLHALADLTAKAFNTIDNLNISRSSTEISEFWSDSKEEMLELYKMGAYGDQRLVDYMVSILGADKWNEALKEAIEKGGGYKEAMSKYMAQIESDSFSMYSDWARAAKKLDYVSIDSSGSIVFDFSALGDEITNTDELITHMSEQLGLSKSYVEAMIVDMSTFSSEFRLAYEDFSGNNGLETLLSGAGTYQYNGATYLNVSREQLEYFVEDVDAFVEKWNDLGDTKIDLEAELVLEDGTFTDRLKSLVEQDIRILATIDVNSEIEGDQTLYNLITEEDTNKIIGIEFENEEQLFWTAKELYQANLDKGMLEDQARDAVEDALTNEEYNVTLNGKGIKSEVLTPILDAVQNEAITIAAIEQAEIVGAVYGEAVFQAIIQAMALTLGTLPGYQEYSFSYGGTTYYTNSSPDVLKPQSQGGDAEYKGVTANGTYYDLSKFTYDPKTGKYVKTEDISQGSTNTYDDGTKTITYDPTTDTVIVQEDWGWHSDTNETYSGDKVTADFSYPVTVVDENGQEKTIVFETAADFEDFVENPNSTTNKFKDENGNWVSFEYNPTQSENAKKEYLSKYYGENYDPNGDIDAQWEAFKKTDTYKKITTAGYTDPDSRKPFAEDTGADKDKEDTSTDYGQENANRQLEALNRIRDQLDREAELIDKLPEEIAGPLKLLNTGEQMLAEYKEIQINKNKLEGLEIQKENFENNAEYFKDGYYYYDDFLETYMYDVEKMKTADDETAQKIVEEYGKALEISNERNAVADELDGGKIQKFIKGLAKASTGASKALKKTEKASDLLNEEFGDLAKKFGLSEELDKFGKSIDKAIDESEFLKKEFKGLGIASEETLSKIDELPLGDATKDLIKNTFGHNEEGTVGSWMGDLFGAGGEMLGGLGDILNSDMMGMGLDMFNQMKDMASQMIQYVVQFVQTIINWWINREDWLYNLLSAIEQEVHNFNRQEQVEERFRLYSDEGLNDLVSAWEAMRESLEKQIDLNEQLIESRQAELQFLNLTNLPFSPAFYYDYTEERVIENPWVYDIYVLLLDLGAMLPEIGGIFSSIKQLMEDNKKRMEDAVKEIEDAREEILELEKQQLELRTKYMEDEIELEELIMDTIIEKQQEEIDELSAMNDAISEGNEKLIDTLNNKLDLIRQQRDNEDKEEELGEKERRLAYLRQDTSNANRKEIMDLSKELKDERRDYTDELIDQKISALEEQNERAAEQRQKQIDLLQAQLDYTEKYGLHWAEAQTLIKNGFDSEGRLRVGTDLFDMLMSKEDFTSMGLGSTRQVQQIMDWNVTSIAAAAFREINDIWDEGFGNFTMSNDVHDQSRLHLWADREVDYRQLPSWLSFLQPAYNTVQDYFWRTGNNIGTFAETSWGSGKNSTSILGKTIVPLLQELLGTVKGKYEEYNSLSVADGYVETTTGVITSTMENVGYDWGERMVKSLGNGFAALGDSFTEGIRAIAQSNSLNNQTSTQSIGDITVQVHIDSEDTEDGYKFGENIANAFREGLSNLSIFK